MKLDKNFRGALDNILVDMEDSAREKAKAGIEKAVKATIKKKIKKKRKAFGPNVKNLRYPAVS